ncbi:MAG: TonB-dependent receptor, partial [Saprospiraceae bacterium]|nr:TonB-dependent receptor [Saprospiraceae bacterium]
MRIFLLSLIFLCLGMQQVKAQDQGSVSGQILERKDGETEPLIGANIFWVDGTTMAITDEFGMFSLEKVKHTDQLVISHIAFENDTLLVGEQLFLTLTLDAGVNLDEVTVKSRKRSTEVSYMNPLKTEKITEKELAKAACCNLSESFETSPSVDVSFTDAVTGTRQIQLLGLAGPYTQMTREMIPDIRGLSALNGLSHSPGTWVESIQLNKGAGSVVNGFESIAGQINVELEKPEETERVFVNLYGNIMGRAEANVHAAHSFSPKLHTGLLAHYSQNSRKNDSNDDGFMDNPLKKDLILLNRWRYIGDKGIRSQFGVKYTTSNHFGGQLDYDGLSEENNPNLWGLDLNNDRMEAWAKIGWVNEAKPWESVGLQLSAMDHSQISQFGNQPFNADQNLFYANLIYNGILGNTNNTIKAGLSYQLDTYEEHLGFGHYERNESVPGAFAEYTYTKGEEFAVVLGLRGDYHNNYGFFATPRVHARYAPNSGTVIRASAGRGQRTANIFAENFALFASNRNWLIFSRDNDNPYGLNPEIAWNYGVSLSQDFTLDYREGMISVDFFRTDFQDQVVVDVDSSPNEVRIYNLQGKSFSNSLQFQVDYELIKRLDLRIAYRLFDVKTDYTRGLLEKPLTSRNRAFINFGYETSDSWSFDYTLNWQGKKRIPFTGSNPAEFQLDEYSRSFVLMNAQVSKS